jgi:aspartokinase
MKTVIEQLTLENLQVNSRDALEALIGFIEYDGDQMDGVKRIIVGLFEALKAQGVNVNELEESVFKIKCELNEKEMEHAK